MYISTSGSGNDPSRLMGDFSPDCIPTFVLDSPFPAAYIANYYIVATVTGGASSIDFPAAGYLIKQNWAVAIVDYNAEGGRNTAQELGEKVCFAQADVSSYDQLASSFVLT
ncbi:hypothetical protein COCVIDRAFT_17124 [Bipolaris victoriae FI3]|uniref:Uncharacterized protein n=1 Tax=Bipolaris victoriae (strain FI3) TaxID=930091 RepID=W7EC29_BIPV3|nr:hypothetical protein COCVIDRAFT_17124 [Bipolaris victoriae FI3]